MPFIFKKQPDHPIPVELHIFIAEIRDQRWVVITDDIARVRATWSSGLIIEEIVPNMEVPLVIIKTDQVSTAKQLENEKTRIEKELKSVEDQIAKEKAKTQPVLNSPLAETQPQTKKGRFEQVDMG
jgi:hypothetical protein